MPKPNTSTNTGKARIGFIATKGKSREQILAEAKAMARKLGLLKKQ